MINPFKQVNWKPDTPALRSFAKSLVIGFPIIAILFLVGGRLLHGDWNTAFALKLAGGGVLAGGLFWLIPVIARPFYLVWYAVSCAMGVVIGNVLLSLFYFTLFTIVGILRRTLGTSPIQRGPKPGASTYWIDAPPAPEASRYFSQS